MKNEKGKQKQEGKSFWLYLHPYTYLSIKKDRALLYNTLNGEFFEYRGETDVARILRKLNQDKNLYTIRLKQQDITPPLNKFISDIRESYSGDIVDTSLYPKKPAQLKPMVHLERTLEELTFKPKINVLECDEIGEYLNELTLYINSDCDRYCSHCSDAYKQFLTCNGGRSQKRELSTAELLQLLEQVKETALYKLNILGGNILKHSEFKKIIQVLNKTGYKKDYYLSYLNINTQEGWLELLKKECRNTLHIFIHLPVKEELFLEVVKKVQITGLEKSFHFIVESEENMILTETLISKTSLENVELHPYFNGGNYDFFRKNVFCTKDAIIESKPTMKDIFARTVVNTLSFKILTVMSNKSVYANVNHPRIGKLGKKHIVTLIKKEMCGGKSWNRIRKNVSTCKSCAFNALCPPISNYEYCLGKYNLCSIK